MSLTARSWRAALRRTGCQNLSGSAIRQRHTLPTFEPSSTKELDDLLDLARRRIFVPAHLNPAQQRLVYRDEHRARLSADAPEPLWTTVAGADVALEHIDRQRDVPRRWRVFSGALALARTRADWDNVGRLLEGFHDAGVRLSEAWARKLVRTAGGGGGIGMPAVLRALQRAERSGVRLRDASVVEQVLWQVRGEAARNGWGERETERALAWAKRVVELMEAEEHCGGKGRKVESGDPRTLPFVIATPLELAAVRTLRYRDGVDEDGMVRAYAERLCVNLKHYGTQIPTQAEEASATEAASEQEPKPKSPKPLKSYERFTQASYKLRCLIPVWHGLKLAQRVLGEERMPLDKVETYVLLTELREEIERAIEAMQANLKEGQSVEKHADFQAWQDVKDD